jgi:amino acid adenylation domain-containing protein/thioester reductase-like protein
MTIMDNTQHQLEGNFRLSPLQTSQPPRPINSSACVEQASIHLSGSLNHNTLQTAWSQLVKQHSILRSCITSIEMNQQLQQADQHATLPWQEHDWRGSSENEQTKQLSDFLAQDQQQGFVLNEAPLLRLTLIRLSDDRHQCVVSYHPIILDRESIRLLCQRLMKTYLAACNQQPVPADTTECFQDYIDNVATPAPVETETYRQNYLNGRSEPTPLPIANKNINTRRSGKNNRTEQENSSGHLPTEQRNLSRTLTSTLTDQARQLHPLKSLLQATWAILLSRYSGGHDSLFGHIVSGRPTDNQNEATLIGPFNHTVPIAITVDPLAHVLPWLQTLEQNLQEQVSSQSPAAPAFETWSNTAANSVSYHTAITFNAPVINNNLNQQLADANLAMTALEFHQPTPYPLTLFLEIDSQLTMDIVYDPCIFETDAIKRLLDHYHTLLNGIVDNPMAKIADLPLLTKQEKQRIFVAWNDTQVDFPREQCIHQLFEAQVAKTPNAVAVLFEDQPLSYEALNQKSNQLAHYLIEQGVGPDINVGLCIERSLDMIIGLLGILKAGGVYVPIDPEYPQQRIDYLVEDSGIVLLLTQTKLNHTVLSQQTTPRCCLDQIEDRTKQYRSDNPAISITPEHLIYVIYTSGSTGKPKGVAINHGAYLNHMQWMLKTFTLSRRDKVLQKTSLSFDAAGWEWSLPLISGAQLVLAKPGGQRDPEYLLNIIDQHQISFFQGVPSLVNLLIEHPHSNHLQSLKYLFCGGEPLSTHLCERFKSKALPTVLCNLYGPTEATIDTSYWVYDPDKPLTTVPIGRPINNVQLYILDSQLNPVPIGVTGELYIGGSGLAREYLNRKTLTDETFIHHSLDGQSFTRLYRSGDLARYLPDGNIEYVGRIDDQVKVRGFRIELGEIEKALLEHSDIHEAVVQSYRHNEDNGNHYLAAYIVCNDVSRGSFDHVVLQNALKTQLPNYMVPSFLIRLDALPLTPNGKVDRKALPAPNTDDLFTHNYVAPRTKLETTLVEIWANILNLPVEKIGIEDSFIQLGGHSLLAIRISGQVKNRLNLTISLNDIFIADTIGLLAKLIEQTKPSGNVDIPLIAIARTQPITLSYAQQRLWFIHEFEGGTDTRYNEPLALKIKGELSVTALQQAIQIIVQRHEILRTTYQTNNGEAVQIIADDWLLDIPVHETTENLTPRLIEDHMTSVFDLSKGPLIKVCILVQNPGEHVLLINMHHIVCDGWSMEVFGHELTSLYEYINSDNLDEPRFPLPPLPLQYADVSDWQQRWLTDDKREQQLQHWKTQLTGAPALLELPTDRPRPPEQSYSGSRCSFDIPATLTEQLRKLGQQTGTTLFMTLLAGFNILLSRYSGQEDICIGTPIANRQKPEIEDLIGFFVNTLVLRTAVNGQSSAEDFLKSVKTTALAAYANQDIPFEQLVEALKPERSLSYSPLFQVMFALQDPADAAFKLHDITVSQIDVDTHKAKFDLTLFVTEEKQGLTGIVEYNTDLFDATTIERFSNHYVLMLTGMSENPQQRLIDLPLLTQYERQQILFDWNSTEADYPKDKCIHQLFEEQVAKTPKAIAVVFENQQLSYKILSQKSNQLAQFLIEQGVGPGVNVGLCVERSLDMIIGLLGILKAGGAYVPLDPNFPLERLEYMLADSCSALVLTQSKLLNSLPELFISKTPAIALDRDWNNISSAEVSLEVSNNVHTKDLAYVIYTSGSTGKPKGVMIPHKALVNFLVSMGQTPGLQEHDSLLAVTTYCFDIAGLEFYLPLITGATVYICDGETTRDPDLLIKAIDRYHPTVMQATPATWMMLFQAGWKNASNMKILCGGEALSEELKRRFVQTKSELWNLFGPTETTIWSTVHQELPGNATNIGKPIANTQVYIIDHNSNIVPIGVPGELCIAGDGLARGYFNRPELTAEKFVANPFSNSSKLYKTGDLCRWLPDGNIEYVGRIDHQIKIRGFRIELGEIENALSEHTSIQKTIVVAQNRPEQENNYYLSAYIVCDPSASTVINAPTLKAALNTQLPEYMIPSFFVFLDTLPLTPNGKIDRKALPIPDDDHLFTQDYVSPRTDIENALVDIWAEVLAHRVNKIGIHDNFFELGGHSLLATRVVSLIRKTLATDIPIRDLFIANTIHTLAALVEQRLTDSPLCNQEAFPLQRVSRDQPLPLSFAQQRLWFLSQFENSHSPQYNIPWALRLHGVLNAIALEKAFNALLEHHESLRTTFYDDDGQTVQIIADHLTLTLPAVAITEAEIPVHLVENINHAFALCQGPLFRVKLLRLSDNEHLLLINLHHIIADGWSIAVLNEELSHLYGAFSQGNEPNLSPLPVQYADFAHWQRQWLQGERLEQQVDYWKTQLSGAPPLLELPTDRTRPATQRYQGSHLTVFLPAELTQSLHQLSRQSGATLFMALLTGFNLLLNRYSGQDDICVGTPIANRQRPELEELIGFFVNTLVLRTRIDRELTCTELLQQVKDTALSAYAHQDIPFEHLVEALQPERSLSYPPLFQTMFVLQNAMQKNLDLPGISVSPVDADITTAKFDLTMSIEETDRGLSVWVDYNTDLFDHSTIGRMVDHYQRLLEGMVSTPNQRVMDLPILGEVERNKILFDCNDTQVDHPNGKCIHQLFDEQVSRTPNAIAVVFENQQLSYQALNQKSNQLAHYLIKQGVGPEVRVGLCVERSLQMIIGLLGILKAGGAYVPIDPNHPQQRKNFLINDSGAKVLLTQKSLRDSVQNQQSVQLFYLDEQSSILSDQPITTPDTAVNVSNLVYVIYTSGSTGIPKGVAVSHFNLSQLCYWHHDAFHVTPETKATQLAGIGFDAMAWELWPYLSCGASITLVKQDLVLMPEKLIRYLHQHDITHCFAPTPLAENLIAQQWPQQNSLTYMLTGGDRFKQYVPSNLPFVLINNYGPTESTVVTTSGVIEAVQDSPPSIGRVIDNVNTYVLDKALEPVPIGVVGELAIGGNGLARGYLDRAALTAEKFIPHPFSQEPGARLYQTGDLVRYFANGNINFVGRVDDQIKIRGFRIELGEIESTLTQQPGIREAIVIAHRSEQDVGNHYLAAYVVSDENTGDQTSLQAALQSQLPEYMVPSFFVFLDTLPLTPNGKVDRKALPVPNDDHLFTQDYVAPRTDIEKALADIWAEVLARPVNKIGILDNFFELGGHSLLATRVVSQIRHTLGTDIPIRDLFTANTVHALATRVEQRLADSSIDDQDAFPLQRISRDQSLPLSFAQQRLWFLNQFEDGHSTQYNIPWALRLHGALDVIALEKAFNALIERHESLRTSFYNIDGQTVQIIADQLKLTFPTVAVTESAIPEHLAESINHVFVLSQGPLFRVKLLHLTDSDHLLLVNLHHIIADGWSIVVLNEELTQLYSALTQGVEPTLSPLPVQYADFAHWQLQWLQGERLEHQVDYWKTQLSGAPALLELPTDRPRPATQRYQGNHLTVCLPVELTQALHQLSRQSEATLFMTLLTGFNLLLNCYSGQDDICVGTPIANRQRPELEKLIGFFVNTLVLRTRIDRELTCTELLQQVKETALSAYAHQDIPFEHLVEALQPERSLSYPPLFQVMFVLQNTGQTTLNLPGITASPVETDITTAKFDLTMSVEETSDGISLWLDYNTDLFDHNTIECMVGHYQQLLKEISDNPNQRVMDLPILNSVERQQILFDWNNTQADYPKDRCIHQLFEEQVEKTPHTIAVVLESQSLSYEVLSQKSNQLAHYLIEQGVGPEINVGLCVERSLDMIIGLLGILKAGGAYVPIDPEYPEHRISYILKDSNINLLLTQRNLLHKVTENLSINRVCFDSDSPAIALQQTTPPLSKTQSTNIAYVIYTSGSTGTPKGVAVSHRSVNRLVINNSYVPTDKQHHLLQSASISFDAATYEIWGALLNGNRCILYPERIPTLEKLEEIITTEYVDTLWITTGLFNLLVDEKPDIIKHLKYILTGGEIASNSHILRAVNISPATQILNMYGPTENTTFSTSYRVQNNESDTLSAIPIGKSINNSTTYILNREMNIVPLGVVGELYLGGDGLAREYQDRPALTAEKFVPHPYSQQPGARLYQTGDLVRHLTDGNIEFVGRIDDQIKIRGFRIELGEIENALTQQSAVREATIIAHRSEQDAGNHYLAAYVVSDEDTVNQATLRTALQSKLPEYMVPSFFMFLDALPLTPNGKVDRKALPVPNDDNLFTQDYVVPRTDIEKALVDIWANVLTRPINKISIHDNFFELGGHSLLATRVVSQIRNTLGTDLPIRDLFTANTVLALATRVEQRLADSPLSDQDAFPLVPVSRDQPLPLSFAQQRLWFLNQFEDGHSTQYNIPWALRLQGALDVTAVEKAFNALIERHESLRTTFDDVDGQTIQIVADQQKLTLPIAVITEAAIPEPLAESINHVFDLCQGPLFWVRLLRFTNSDHLLLVNLHHIIADGWSIAVFNEELTHLYSAFTQGIEPTLSPLPIQYADFAHWQRRWLQGERLEQQVDYWKIQLSGAPALLELPTDRPRPATQSHQGNHLTVLLPAQLTQALHQLSRQSGATLFMTLLTGFNLLLNRYSGQDDICVGTPIANRQRPELEKLIGFFVNTLVLRTRIDRELTCAELLQQVKDTALSAYAHQDIPFEHLVEALQPERSLSYPPLFQVMFTLQNAGQNTLELPGITVSPLDTDISTAKFDLNMSIEETDSGLSVWIDYNTDLFDHSTIERMVGHYQRLLEAMVSDANQRVMDLAILSDMERQQLLLDWNDTHADYPKDQCIHQLFETQVSKTPNAIAVVFENQRLSYQALNQKSNQLAHYLIEQDVGPDVTVGLCVERSLDMIIGLLGILKAGGAYIPIDPEYPQQRIDYLVENSGMALLLTQAKLNHTVLSQQTTPRCCLDQIEEKVKHYRTDNPAANVTPEHLVYVIYTSGSTGKPKGVAISHGAYLNHMQWMLQTFSLSSSDKVLQKTSLSFDAAGWEWSLPLISGAQLVLAKPGGQRDPEYLLNTIEQHQISIFQGVPSLVNLLVEHPHSDQLQSLKYLFCGGEPLSIQLCERFRTKALPATLCNLYGPTEATIDTSYWLYDPEKPLTTVPIGRPINNVQLYILDPQLNPVPIGVAGELYIGGSGLAREYLNRKTLTDETFIHHSLDGQSLTLLYRSGDLARYLPDGNIEYVRRIDDQVKVRGFRIELGEIEKALMEYSDVHEAVVQAYRHDEDNGNHYLAAYIVCYDTSNESFDQIELKNTLKTQLPNYMLPSFFIRLDTLPLTPNGKVDRNALPKPNADDLLTHDYVAPRTEIEKSFVEIWAKILALPTEKVGVEDNFFELGGHSILATKLIAPLRGVCGQEIPLRALFDYPTVASLVTAIASDQITTDNGTLVDLNKEAVLDPAICAANAIHPSVETPNTILLTGATGFIGRFLLCELLQQTSARIVCLVRGKNGQKSKQQAFERLKAGLLNNRLWKAHYQFRIDVVVGDIGQPRFGLSEPDFGSLSEQVDAIYHNATAMNHIASYHALKAATVGGVHEILRLACTHRLKPVHYSSTVSVFSQTASNSQINDNNQERTVDENTSIEFEQHHVTDGYTSTKWVAEKLVMLAQDRGIPCCIYRFGLVTGDTQQGRYDKDQWLYRLISSAIHLGYYPTDYCPAIGLIPVDIAAKSLVFLSQYKQHATGAQTTFHLSNPEQIDIRRFFEVYNMSCGHSKQLKALAFKQWLQKLKQFVDSIGENEADNITSIYPLLMQYAGRSEDDQPNQNTGTAVEILCTSTLKLLGKGDLSFPAIDQSLIETYLQFISGEPDKSDHDHVSEMVS